MWTVLKAWWQRRKADQYWRLVKQTEQEEVLAERFEDAKWLVLSERRGARWVKDRLRAVGGDLAVPVVQEHYPYWQLTQHINKVDSRYSYSVRWGGEWIDKETYVPEAD